ncbi:hypothetical protein Tco_1577519, partial [Tanacetum coccineum]
TGPDNKFCDKSRNFIVPEFIKEPGIRFKNAFRLRLSLSRLVRSDISGLRDPVKLLLASESTLRLCNFSSPLPIFPDRFNPSSDSPVTRLVAGLHVMYFHEHGVSSSSLQEDRLDKGSLIYDLKTIRPKTSSLRVTDSSALTVNDASEINEHMKR